MGTGWSEEQTAQIQQPATSNVTATRSDEHDRSNSSNSVIEEKKKGAEVKVAHGFEAILKDADLAVDRSSVDKLHDQLYAGIFLNKRTKKYWLDKKTNSNCFMLFPRALSIIWAEENKYWKWKSLEESSNTVEIIELLNVCWLEINGKIKTSELSPGTQYEAAFVVMIKDPAYGWEVSVNIRLKRPDGSKHEYKENLLERPRGRWIEIPVGDFMVPDRENGGEIEMSMYEHEGGMWKKGMLVKGVVIRPKESDLRMILKPVADAVYKNEKHTRAF